MESSPKLQSSGWAPELLLNYEIESLPPLHNSSPGEKMAQAACPISTSPRHCDSQLPRGSWIRRVCDSPSAKESSLPRRPTPAAPAQPLGLAATPGVRAPPGLEEESPPPKPWPTMSSKDRRPARAPPGLEAPSLGSIGHPTNCAEACKYRKRQSGCLRGPSCPNCHVCFRRHRRANVVTEERSAAALARARQSALQAAQRVVDSAQKAATLEFESDALVAPEPTDVPPTTFMAPRPADVPATALLTQGEQARAAQPLSTAAAAVPSGGGVVGGGSEDLGEPTARLADMRAREVPSAGSLGHPLVCGLPCKYARRPRGCQDGGSCTRCHLCIWTRRAQRG